MSLVIQPESGIPFLDGDAAKEHIKYKERARAAVNVIRDMLNAGAEINPDAANRSASHDTIASNFTRRIPISESNTATLAHLGALLDAYDYELIHSARRVQNYVVNRLIEETENEDPKIRLRALELLGKTAMAKVFSENINVQVTHTNISDIDAELSAFAKKYTEVVDVPMKELPEASDE